MVKKNTVVRNIALVFTVLVLMAVIVFLVGRSFGFFNYSKKGQVLNVVTINGIDVRILNNSNNALNLENAYPMYDSEGMEQDSFDFSINNTSSKSLDFSLKVVNDVDKQSECVLDDGNDTPCTQLSTNYIRYSYKINNGEWSTPANLETNNNIIFSDTFSGKERMDISIKIWIDQNAGNSIQNHYFFGKLIIEGAKSLANYRERILNGTDPVLTSNLIPVTIANDGTVSKADVSKKWYSYEEKKWANAVVLKDNTVNYSNGQTIPESNIESYFVWIPKYSYQLWDLGEYTNYFSTSDDDFVSNAHAIPIQFGTTNTTNTDTTCVSQTVAGANTTTGDCAVGKYMTHPAFLAFSNSTGFWTGKFETGFDYSTSTDIVDTSKIMIKPNTYSWRGITLGNMFENSYTYLRNEDSHMMKNTEWGAVAYLSHSIYGTCTGNNCTEVRINNNSKYVTGYSAVNEPTVGYNGGISLNDGTQINEIEDVSPGNNGTLSNMYNTAIGYLASTTGNITGIYDMSGGAYEYVLGYTLGASSDRNLSQITSNYPDFFSNNNCKKYYDEYQSIYWTSWNNRILGDATGELGPFIYTQDLDINQSTENYNSRPKSSWYKDYAYFVNSYDPWFVRGVRYNDGVNGGLFSFYRNNGARTSYTSFRIVLTPTNN